MQGRQIIEGTRGLSTDSPQQLNKLCYCPVSTRGVACAR